MTAQECAAALKAYRSRYQLTQAQAAAALGIPLRTLQNWEIARYCPSAFAQAALRWLLARPPGALAEESSPASPLEEVVQHGLEADGAAPDKEQPQATSSTDPDGLETHLL